MAYDKTDVPVQRSQTAIRDMVMSHQGFGVAFVSERDPEGKQPALEGFHAKVTIDKKPYAIKVMARLRPKADVAQEERRVWRVLFYHMKAIYESSDSGVLEFREMMLPYLIRAADGKTIAEIVLPQLDTALRTDRMLIEGKE